MVHGTYQFLNPETNQWEFVLPNCVAAVEAYEFKEGLYLDLSYEDDEGGVVSCHAPVRKVA